MEYGEYLDRRSALIKQADEAVKQGTAESVKRAESLTDQVRDLDEEWTDREKRRMANERALSGGQTRTVLPWMSGETADFVSGRCYSANEGVRNSLFLGDNRSMVDVARDANPDATFLLGKNGALGSVVRGMVTGKWDSAELRNIVTTTSTGTLIPAVLSAQIIDQMRNISLFASAGVPIVPMESNNMTISRVKSDPVFSFKEEGAEATESAFELDGVELKAKTAYGYAYVSIEAVQSSQNLDAVMRQVFAAAMANAVDLGMLYGQKNGEGFDSFAPAGIMNDENILTVSSGEKASYDDIVKAAGAIRRANGLPGVWAVNAATDESLELLKDSTGQYLAPPASISTMQKIVSNQLAADQAAGSDGLVFDPMAMIIGLQNNLVIKIIEDGKCLKNGLVGFQIYSMLDCRAVRPKAICKITGMK